MMILWLYFAMWIALTLVDIAISARALDIGATEVGVLYQLTGAWWITVVTKMILAIIIGLVLVYRRKETWLALLTVGMTLICAYDVWALLRQAGG